MPEPLTADKALLDQLPLPLAQLYRRTVNGKNALERHQAAYYLWEATLKLLGSTAVVIYAKQAEPDPELAPLLESLARPQIGQWWGIAREFTRSLAASGDAGFQKVAAFLFSVRRDDLPYLAGLDAALRDAPARSTVEPRELFDRLVAYRNKLPGHGAIGMHQDRFYERMAKVLRLGIEELLRHLNPCAYRELIYIARVEQSAGRWLVDRFSLTGEAPARRAGLDLQRDATTQLPDVGQVYLQESADESLTGLTPLQPLVIFDMESGQASFLNARRGKARVQYLCYATGEEIEHAELAGERRELLARALRLPVHLAPGESPGADFVDGGDEESQEASGDSPGAQWKTLGEFDLISELGRGGMGVVYRAWQPSLRRQVALKTLLRIGDATTDARFRREIRALGKVDHPHLVKVHTSGVDGERWFYAMELVEGASLASVAEKLSGAGSEASTIDGERFQAAVSTACDAARAGETPLSAEITGPPRDMSLQREQGPDETIARAWGSRESYINQIVELIRQAADAAHALHQKGIVHRDIKPGNILVNRDGTQAVLMDLGLAQLEDDLEAKLTKTRQFVGTPRYASPEHVLGVEKRLDPRTDVYSLGATLWELLALKPILGADDSLPTNQVFQMIQRDEPERLRQCNRAVSRDLEAIVHKCLEKNPKARYTSAAELSNDLRRYLTGKPVRARRVSSAGRALKWAKRRPALAALAAVSILAAVALLAGGIYFNAKLAEERGNVAHKDGELTSALADVGRQESALNQKNLDLDRMRRDARQILARSNLILADSNWTSGNALATIKALAAVPEDLRHWEWGYQQRRAMGGYMTLWGHAHAVMCVAFSPDGARLASGSMDRTVRLLDAKTGALMQTLSGHTNWVTSVAFSPDGARLASGSHDHTVKLWDAKTGTLMQTLTGHTNWVTSVAFSPDGARLASAGADKTVRLWDAKTGALLQTLSGHNGGATSVAFSPDGARLASGSYDYTAKLWDAKTGTLQQTLSGHTGSVLSVAFSPDGARLASGGDDNTVRLWDAKTGTLLQTLSGHTGGVTSVAFSPDSARLASGSDDKTMRLWDAKTGTLVQSLRGHTEGVDAVAFSPDGARLASGSYDYTAKLWDAKTGTLQQTLSGHTRDVTSVAFSPDGARLASASADKTVRLWDAKTGKLQQTLSGHSNLVNSVAFSPDGARLASGSADKTVRLWDAKTGALDQTLSGHTDGVLSVAFSPDGTRLASCTDRTVRLWDAKTGTLLHTLSGHTGGVLSVAFSPDGARLASGGGDNTVRLWDAKTGTLLHTLSGHTDKVWSVAFSPDGARLASGSYDKTVRLWNASTGMLLQILSGHTNWVTSVAFSPDGARLASGSDDKTMRLWNAKTGALLQPLSGHTNTVDNVAFSPDGTRLASGSRDQTVRVWDAKTGTLMQTLIGHTDLVTRVTFSPDGTQLASGSYDKTVRLWDAKTGALLQTLSGHNDGVLSVAFSPDGARLASGSIDRTVRLWDAKTGRLLQNLSGHTDWITSVVFSPDGTRLASASTDGTARLWDAKTGALLQTHSGHTGKVTSVAFSPDGARLASQDFQGVTKVWDAKSGQETNDPNVHQWLNDQAWSSLSPDGQWYIYLASDGTILLVKPLPPDEYELGYRAWFARPDPDWHWEQAQEFEKDQSWFAVKFHCEQVLKSRPNDATAKELLGKAKMRRTP